MFSAETSLGSTSIYDLGMKKIVTVCRTQQLMALAIFCFYFRPEQKIRAFFHRDEAKVISDAHRTEQVT